MKPDDILFAPLTLGWRQLCTDITQWIDKYRDPTRLLLPLDRPRPPGSLLLHELAHAFHERGQHKFWRTEYPFKLAPVEFEFDGFIKNADFSMPFPVPVFGEVGVDFWRSIEDANLVINTYTHYYIFGSYQEALQGLSLLAFSYP